MKITKIFSALIFATLLASCSKDFLEKAPLDTVNTSNFYKTESDALAAINAAYQPLQRPKLYNLRMWASDIYAGNSIVGAGGGSDGIETQDIATFVTKTDNFAALDLWRGPYPGILYCNLVLTNVPAINMDNNLKNRILGEAYFLRAQYYFILVRFFGDAILYTKPVYAGDNLRPFRTPKDTIYNQLIIPDFQKAIKMLPPREQYSGSDVGRASKGAAFGMLAKVYLTLSSYNEKYWQKVVDLCDSVENLGYSLNANYADNFNPTNKNTQESLFEVQYSSNNGGYGFFDDEFQSSWVSTFTGPRNNLVAGAYGWDQPTQEFVDSYEAGDLRKDITILYKGCPDFYGQTYDSTWSYTGFNLRKFLVPKSIASSYDNNPEDFPVLRYADVLLMKSEALNELGRTSDAETPLNEVRTRAGLANVSGLSKDAFREKVLHERRIELAFEGQRWFDLIRINNGQWGLDFLHSIGKSNATSKFLLLPVPQADIDIDPNLTQNTGY